ncbi:30S ribosomal protein S5 [Candidatus Hodgkinia cicadicola]|uniref:Small ribosomal subunit protein uS5 n=1 Tax=Candidatus Hodgkinia cicadicola TaxID=573658 RepID=A0ABX4MH35_9HYPH|nr:30S ribosomal protein S5 [Candidatus Hodgkinia cicadicola]PIM96298.1 30S ribosomal protein S5 [Candidatus Hodgkinia cicadicola]
MKIYWKKFDDEYVPNFIDKKTRKNIADDIEISNLFDGNTLLYEKIIKLTKVCRIVKGGRKYRYWALVVVGDMCGSVGFGMAKANEAQDAVIKSGRCAKNNMLKVPLGRNKELISNISGRYNSTKVLMWNNRNGIGIRASNAIRSIFDALGIKNVSAKIIGSRNPHNVIKATFTALKELNLRFRLWNVVN